MYAASRLPPHTLMERAGLAVAQLTLALAPHAKSIWIPCGPGNNGGDGFVAARILRDWGKCPVVTRLCDTPPEQADALAAFNSAVTAGVTFQAEAPWRFDACVDAIFGIGLTRPPDERCTDWISRINSSMGPVLSIDVPSGLNAETGCATSCHVKADVTLSLLTLKPGLFTADGRDACGDIWFNTLEASGNAESCALLLAPPVAFERLHKSHKGSYGDVAVIGGAHGMLGAAQLAASAALHSGAGRVYLISVNTTDTQQPSWQPEVMARGMGDLDFQHVTVVAGCGGGLSIDSHLAEILRTAGKLVLDADALNAIASSPELQSLTRARAPGSTIMTPHPLEAARLIGSDTQSVQANRINTAKFISETFNCAVVLKGSGSVVVAPNQTPCINPTGNARLASPGTGDVLAGMVGALMAAGESAFVAGCNAAYRHGRVADLWQGPEHLTAHGLAASL